MSEALLSWRTDDSVEAVVIDHAEGRGFCAGGDVVMLARSGSEDASEAKRFFFAEYRLNHLLFTYPKPTVAIMDGITMGGGVGISLPCDFRIATENTRLAMPETGIGLFPDVGGGWYLPRLPGRVGQFMALTGARLDGAECHYLGLATHYVEQAALDGPGRPDRQRRRTASQGALGAVAANRPPDAKIEAEPAADHAAVRLRPARGHARRARGRRQRMGARPSWRRCGTKSPLSCKVSLRLLAEGANRASFADEMKAEYALAGRVVRTHDFREGVRALLIDKDNDAAMGPGDARGGHRRDARRPVRAAARDARPGRRSRRPKQ